MEENTLRPCGCTEASVITVGVNRLVVEEDLAAGRVACPECSGPVARWGWARERAIHGLGRRRPRRGRCRRCGATHVLLPIVMLARRGYSAQIIVDALMFKSRGWGHRRVAKTFGIPAATVRGWIRRMGRRLDEVRAVFSQAATRVWTDRPSPPPSGSAWEVMLDALGAARQALASRFAGHHIVTLKLWEVATALSAGRLLSPGWPGVAIAKGANTSCP